MNNEINILHLEDNDTDAKLIRAKIEMAAIPCQISRVQSRDEFEKALRMHCYDLILADYNLPGYNGIAALQFSMELCPDIPFIFVSGTIGEDAAIEGLTKGATDYVLKQKLTRLIPAVKRAISEAETKQERKQAEKELHKLSRAVEQSPVSIVITDTEGKIEYVNSKFTEVTGYTRNEVIGQNPRILKSGEMSQDNYKQMWQCIISGKEWYGEFHNKKKSGELYWEYASISAIIDKAGVITNFLAVKEDITERKNAENELIKAKEKAEESDKLKTAFLCNMSHEIRTPMNAIIGFSDFLFDPDISTEKKQYYSQIIKERSFDLLKIIEDILDISKIEVRQMQITDNSINLEKIIYELFEYYRLRISRSIKADVMSIKIELAESLRDKKIITDEYRLKQILGNLLDNAFKFTQKGTIEFGCKLASDTELLFFVKDSGIGIPLDKQAIIFDPFRQAEDMMSAREYGGTGLGLSIVKGLIDLMNGKIWFESQPNIGTSFYFTLPVKESNILMESATELKNVTNPFWSKKKILIVEDDKANTEYLQQALSGKGLQILLADTGENALQIVQNNPDINLILMDIRLPRTNGLNLTRVIKQQHPEIIVIAQTAYTAKDDIKKCMDAGCSDYISKPINYQNLISLIDHYFSQILK